MDDNDCQATGGGPAAYVGIVCIAGLSACGVLYLLYCAAQAFAWL